MLNAVMAGVSEYERTLIEAITRAGVARAIERGVGLFIMPAGESAQLVHDEAVLPAMRKNRLNLRNVGVAFDDTAVLEDVCRWVMTAEVLVVDASGPNATVSYVLGLCHGLGRSPILFARDPQLLPFNLPALRCLSYDMSKQGLQVLRIELARRIRVFLASASGAGGA